MITGFFNNRRFSYPKAGAGRAAYIGEEQLLGHVDPGAEAVARVFECLASL